MNPQTPKTAAELSKLARVISINEVPEQYRQSLPIPVISNSEVLVEFIFAPALARPQQPVELFPPGYALTLHLDGALARLWKTSSRDFGMNHDPAQPLGKFGLPEGWTYEDYQSRQARMMQSLDILLPHFEAQDARASDATKAAARDYIRLFRELMEPPLSAWYESIGKQFFAWVRKVA